MAALFIIAKRRNDLCSSTDGWINEIIFSQTMEYYWAIKQE